MAGDLHAKHVEWNYRLITKRGRLLSGYAVKNSYLIYGPNTPTAVPYNPSATPNVLDIAISKDLVSPVYLTTCFVLSSDHIPILIDKPCRSPFLTPPDRPDMRRIDSPNFQACLEAGHPSNPDLPNEVAIDTCVKELSSAISKALTDYTPKCCPRAETQPSLPVHIQDEITPENQLRRQWQITRGPSLKADVNLLQRSVTNQLNKRRNDQWSNTLESLDPENQSLWKMTRWVKRIPTP